MWIDKEYKWDVVKNDVIVNILSRFYAEKDTSKMYDYLLETLDEVYNRGCQNSYIIGMAHGMLVFTVLFLIIKITF